MKTKKCLFWIIKIEVADNWVGLGRTRMKKILLSWIQIFLKGPTQPEIFFSGFDPTRNFSFGFDPTSDAILLFQKSRMQMGKSDVFFLVGWQMSDLLFFQSDPRLKTRILKKPSDLFKKTSDFIEIFFSDLQKNRNVIGLGWV